MELKKGLGLVHVFAIASGAMISSGLFVLPGLAYERAGPAVVLSYLFAAILASTGLVCLIELSTAMPRAGGDYFFVTRSMGAMAGTISGLLSWSSLSLKSAFALFGITAFARLLFGELHVGIDPIWVGLAVCALFVFLNIVGVTEAAWVQAGMVALILILMLLYVIRGLPEVSAQKLEPFVVRGWTSVFSTTGFVFVAYGGLLQSATLAEEVKNPGKTIPQGLILSQVVISIFYTLMVFVTAGVLGERLAGSQTPMTDGANAFMGRWGGIALGVAAIMAFVTTANAGIMAASRYLLAMSRDRLFPEPLSWVNARFQTPHVAVLATGSLVAGTLFVKLDVLVNAASTVFLLTYILLNISVLVMRESGLQNYRPRFRVPLYPWVPLAGIAGFGLVIYQMGLTAFALSVGLIVLGFCIYWFYGRARPSRESALLHILDGLTARELVSGSLEAELKQIIRERDEMTLDRFDELVEQSIVLDLGGPLTVEEFFRVAAEHLSKRVAVDAPTLQKTLMARELQATTVLGHGIAIPHIVIPGEKSFELLLARCRQGITFSENSPPVHAVFVLAGTLDERTFHLRALASIAQVVQDHTFERRWMAARDAQALRDIILLAERRRL